MRPGVVGDGFRASKRAIALPANITIGGGVPQRMTPHIGRLHRRSNITLRSLVAARRAPEHPSQGAFRFDLDQPWIGGADNDGIVDADDFLIEREVGRRRYSTAAAVPLEFEAGPAGFPTSDAAIRVGARVRRQMGDDAHASMRRYRQLSRAHALLVLQPAILAPVQSPGAGEHEQDAGRIVRARVACRREQWDEIPIIGTGGSAADRHTEGANGAHLRRPSWIRR